MPSVGARGDARDEAPSTPPARRSATPAAGRAGHADAASVPAETPPAIDTTPSVEAATPRKGAKAKAGAKDAGATNGKSAGGETGGKRAAWDLFRVRPSVVNVKLIYSAYLASLALPLVAIIGVLYAHQALRANPSAWLASHYTYQVRTFWIGFAANVVALILSFVGIGLLLYPLIAVWVVARSVKGLINVAQRVEIEDPNGFFI
ncbi:DUF4870 family protein [Acuticoccus kandeliae]|uniref:DUF4870 family protein n=1 Tax=Acuticoccus kandeliae TaxID=2073160 RepID=UPI000D3E9EC8|nr:hypothetical protein [Acuticoccus kandeliae]